MIEVVASHLGRVAPGREVSEAGLELVSLGIGGDLDAKRVRGPLPLALAVQGKVARFLVEALLLELVREFQFLFLTADGSTLGPFGFGIRSRLGRFGIGVGVVILGCQDAQLQIEEVVLAAWA